MKILSVIPPTIFYVSKKLARIFISIIESCPGQHYSDHIKFSFRNVRFPLTAIMQCAVPGGGANYLFKNKVCPWFFLVKSCVSCVSPGFFVLLINTCNILVLFSPWRILRKRIWWMRKNFLSLLAGQGRIQKWFGTNCPLACIIWFLKLLEFFTKLMKQWLGR